MTALLIVMWLLCTILVYCKVRLGEGALEIIIWCWMIVFSPVVVFTYAAFYLLTEEW
jgi:hypothetical protein